MNKHYNFDRIRNLLTVGFSEAELRRLSFDIPDFQPVYSDLAQSAGKTEIIARILEYANHRLKVEMLLEWAKKCNPARYHQFEPYHSDKIDPSFPDPSYPGSKRPLFLSNSMLPWGLFSIVLVVFGAYFFYEYTADTGRQTTPIKALSTNPHVIYHDFEDSFEGWTVVTRKYTNDSETESTFPSNDCSTCDTDFPGIVKTEISKDYSLTGQSSLKVNTVINTSGSFRNEIRYKGANLSNATGITIFAFVPELSETISSSVIRMCIHEAGGKWFCTNNVELRNKWTPVTADFMQTQDINGTKVDWTKVRTDLVQVEWFFNNSAESNVVELYIDSIEIFVTDG